MKTVQGNFEEEIREALGRAVPRPKTLLPAGFARRCFWANEHICVLLLTLICNTFLLCVKQCLSFDLDFMKQCTLVGIVAFAL